MATSNAGARPQRNSTETTFSRYDLVLLVIPVAFALALLVTHLHSVSLPLSMAAASIVGVAAVADGLFVNPPGRPERRT